MKYLNLIFIILILSNCKKESPETLNIEYPETGTYGINILFGADTLILTEEKCSMKADIPEGNSLKVELSLIGGEPWFYTNEQNWTASSFANDMQTFTNVNIGNSELELFNANTMNIDTILVKYFENGNEETKRRVLIRQ